MVVLAGFLFVTVVGFFALLLLYRNECRNSDEQEAKLVKYQVIEKWLETICPVEVLGKEGDFTEREQALLQVAVKSRDERDIYIKQNADLRKAYDALNERYRNSEPELLTQS